LRPLQRQQFLAVDNPSESEEPTDRLRHYFACRNFDNRCQRKLKNPPIGCSGRNRSVGFTAI
jgi:hypothetical protein